jgi:hypothetical protein
MAPAQKKAVIRTLTGELHWGYLPFSGFLSSSIVSIMAPDGRHNQLSLNNIKAIAYVRDFNLDDPADPERLGRKTFLGRPRGDGLWLRLTLLDNDILEGLASPGIDLLDSLIDDHGILLAPPDTRGNTQRLFVPRSAIRTFQVLGFVTAPSKRLAAKPVSTTPQPTLFDDPPPSGEPHR